MVACCCLCMLILPNTPSEGVGWSHFLHLCSCCPAGHHFEAQPELQLLLQSGGNTFIEAYGRILGTQLVCCWVAVALSFMPPRMLRRCFPPMVTGLTIFLIGAGLIGTGLKVGLCSEHADLQCPAHFCICSAAADTSEALICCTSYLLSKAMCSETALARQMHELNCVL